MTDMGRLVEIDMRRLSKIDIKRLTEIDMSRLTRRENKETASVYSRHSLYVCVCVCVWSWQVACVILAKTCDRQILS